MTEEQIPKLMAILVEHQKLFAGLAGEDAQWAIQHPREAIQIICGALGGVTTPPRLPEVVDSGAPVRYKLKVWKTIQVGGVSRAELFARVDRITPIGEHTQVIVRRPDFPVSPIKREVNLVKLSLNDLGLDSWPSSNELPISSTWVEGWSMKHLDGQTLRLCEADVAPHLLFELLTDERKLDLWMAMEPLPAPPPSQSGSILGLSEECGLHVCRLHSDRCWNIYTTFVFKLENLPPRPPTATPSPAAPAP